MLKPVTSRRKHDQGGFILLVVFLMAGAVALMLYAQLPRVAFESEREKEQLLIERGEQYVRAIQLYQVDNAGQWPQSVDDLEKGKSNGKRYLRRRYIDPYTGKDEWRLIHTNGVQLTDSLVQKATTDPNGSQSASSSTTNNGVNQEPQVNAAVLERPSDLTLPGAQQFNAPTPQQVPGQPPNTPQFGAGSFGVPGVGLPPGVQLPGNVQTVAGPGATPVQQPNGFQPQFPGQQFPGQPAPPGAQGNTGGFQPQFPGQQFAGQAPPPGVQLTQPSGQPGNLPQAPPGFMYGPNGQLIPAPIGTANNPGPQQGGAGTPGLPQGTPNNAAANAIMGLLTTPRAAAAGAGTTQNTSAGQGGIAGVASTHKGPSIKVYKDQQSYEKWEFVYTPRQNTGGVGGAGTGQPGQNGQQGGQNGQQNRGGQQNGQGFNGTGTGTGGGFNGTGSGAGGGFGLTPSGFSQPGQFGGGNQPQGTGNRNNIPNTGGGNGKQR